MLKKKRKKRHKKAAAQKQAEQGAKDAQAQPAQQPAAAQPAQTQAQPATPANNAVQAPKEESKKKNLKRRSEKPAPVVTNDGGGRQDVVEKAKGLVGLKYVWGSASISNGGFDCSGLISYVYGLGRQDTRSLWSSVQKISPSEAKPGDLIFLQGTYRAGVSHVGIYIGGGQMIHVADESTGVAYGSVNSSYNQKHFLGYGRL